MGDKGVYSTAWIGSYMSTNASLNALPQHLRLKCEHSILTVQHNCLQS